VHIVRFNAVIGAATKTALTEARRWVANPTGSEGERAGASGPQPTG
jgi:hypothetical protein